MSVELGRLQALITADDRDFNRKMDRAESRGRTTAGRIRSTFSSLRLNLPDIGGALSFASGNLISSGIERAIGAITSGMTDFVKTGIQYNKTIENATVALETLGMSSADAAQHLAELEKLSLKTPFEYQDVIRATLSLNAFGFSAQTRMQDLTALSDAAAIAAAGNGKFADSFQGIVMALGQMRSKNKVSAEEMNQLAERGIPAWDILSKKIGIAKAELMKLGEQGRLSGEVGSRLLIEGLGEFARGTGERLSRTTQGRESNAADAYSKRAGEDVRTSGALASYQEALDRTIQGLDQKVGQSVSQGILKGAADGFSAATNIVSDWLSGSVSTKEIFKALPSALVDTFNEIVPMAKSGGASLWQGISDGFSGAFDGTKDLLKGKVSGWASGLIQSAKDTLGIKSPSRVFAEIGRNVVAGFDAGLSAAGRSTPGVVGDWMNQSLEAGKRGAQRRQTPETALRSLMEREPAFIKKLEEIAKRLQTRPEWLLQVMAFETAGTFDPSKRNPTSSATGLIQFMAATAKSLGTTTDALARMTATDQLAYVEKYFKPFVGQLDSLGAVYNAVSGGFRRGGTDESMVYGPGRHANFVAANPGWDANKDGRVTRGELAQVASAALSAEAALRALAGATQTTAKQFQTLSATPYLSGAEAARYAFAIQPATVPGTALPDTEALTRGVSVRPPIEEFVFATSQMGRALANVGEVAAPVPPALEGVGGGMDAVTKSATGAADILIGAAGELGKTWAQLEKQFNKDALTNLGDEARFGRFKDFQQRLGQGFDDVIESLVQGGDRWKDALSYLARDFFNSLVQELMLAATGGKYGSIGGLLGGLVGGIFQGLFSGVSLPAAGAPIPIPALTAPAFAMGGAYPGGLALVGEQGPELINFARPGQITPARQTAAILREAAQPQSPQKNVVININVPINAPNGSVPPQTRQQIAMQAAIAAEMALRRNG